MQTAFQNKTAGDIQNENVLAKNCQTNKIELTEVLPQANLSAKTIWGTLIGNLRKLNLMTLHTACGEIRDVSFDGLTLKAVVKEDYLYNILMKSQNFEKISFYLRQINDKINIQFIKMEKSTDYSQKNLEKLKNIFGSSLEIR